MANSTAFRQLITLLVIALAFSRFKLTLSAQVKGSVTCSDCDPDYDFTGIRVLVKCYQVKNLSEAITNEKGNFETILPSNASASQPSSSPKCAVHLLGGPRQLYGLKQNTVSKIVMAQGHNNTYVVLTPLVFSKSCNGKCDLNLGSSKTFSFYLNFNLPSTNTSTNGTLPVIIIGIQ